jgi:hypothetical protein
MDELEELIISCLTTKTPSPLDVREKFLELYGIDAMPQSGRSLETGKINYGIRVLEPCFEYKYYEPDYTGPSPIDILEEQFEAVKKLPFNRLDEGIAHRGLYIGIQWN